MLELFWIKSLLNFVVICLSGLVLGILAYQKRKGLNRFWSFPVLLILIIHFFGFLRFTIWINDANPLIGLLYEYCFILNFVLGPSLLVLDQKRPYGQLQLLHFLPALGALLLLFFGVLDSTLLVMISQLHFVGYAVLILSQANRRRREMGTNIKWVIMMLWLGAYALHFSELFLWSQFGIISETWAWVLFILSEIMIVVSLLFLTYTLSTKKFRTGSNESSRLPVEVVLKLEKEFTNYITQPQVYTDALINLQKVAKALRVSPHHVSRYLSHHHGDSFLNIINSLRIDASREILEDDLQSAMTIQEICYTVGFNSKSTFNTAFKRKTGKTPSQYRSQFKINA
ncbi:helix-turn-helix domain-containing protein [Flagellimonas flava]|uniref:helix-turn-helix domain-containing protein n=1 Tax=Flagellimonas flava TaxID=570519 RepID=UPI003D64FE05